MYLSDGHVNLAILNLKTPASRAGVDHLGFQVGDLEGTVARVTEMGGRLAETAPGTPGEDPAQPRSYVEVKVAGPGGQEIDVSDNGWAGAHGK